MWARLINAALGIWLMASSTILEFDVAAKNNSVICGALAASFAIIAIWEVTRGLRWLNLLIGAWLLIAHWILGFGSEAVINSVVVGILMVIFSTFRGSIRQQMGGGWATLFGSKGKTNKF